LLQQHKKNDDAQPLVEVDKGANHRGANMELQEYNAIANFTQILTAPICDVDNLLDQDLFF